MFGEPAAFNLLGKEGCWRGRRKEWQARKRKVVVSSQIPSSAVRSQLEVRSSPVQSCPGLRSKCSGRLGTRRRSGIYQNKKDDNLELGTVEVIKVIIPSRQWSGG